MKARTREQEERGGELLAENGGLLAFTVLGLLSLEKGDVGTEFHAGYFLGVTSTASIP